MTTGSPFHLAILGIRGVPARYGGFETCAEELGRRLVARGHRVTVYCRRRRLRPDRGTYAGLDLVFLPTISNRYLDTPVHTFLAVLHACFQSYDAVLIMGVGNAPFAWVPRLAGARTVLHVNGFDWDRQKWPRPARWLLQQAARLAPTLPNTFMTDSRVVERYYEQRFGRRPTCIGYGSERSRRAAGPTLARLGLTPKGYVLFVGRLVPENCAHHLVDAFRRLDTDLRCVIVGDAPYSRRYGRWLRQRAADDPRIVFAGYQYGEAYEELGSNALIFVETAEVGGTHPALVEAMGFGCCTVVNGIPENLETVGPAGMAYDGRRGGEALAGVLAELLASPDRVSRFAAAARDRAHRFFSWDGVTTQYESLILGLLATTDLADADRSPDESISQ